MSNPGWECPKCGTVYAPWVKRCSECPKGMKPPPMPRGVTMCGCPQDSSGYTTHRLECPLRSLSSGGPS